MGGVASPPVGCCAPDALYPTGRRQRGLLLVKVHLRFANVYSRPHTCPPRQLGAARPCTPGGARRGPLVGHVLQSCGHHGSPGRGGSGPPGDSRRLALARGQPGFGTHRDGHRAWGRHSLPGVGPTHFLAPTRLAFLIFKASAAYFIHCTSLSNKYISLRGGEIGERGANSGPK